MLTEKSIRRALNKAGYALHKSRKPISIDNMGDYMVVDLLGGYVVTGSRFDLSLEEVQNWLEA